MKYYELTPEEKLLADVAESGELVSANKPGLIDELKASAKVAGNKTRNINIRISERLLRKLKAKASEEGIPYQTLAASILHKSAK